MSAGRTVRRQPGTGPGQAMPLRRARRTGIACTRALSERPPPGGGAAAALEPNTGRLSQCWCVWRVQRDRRAAQPPRCGPCRRLDPGTRYAAPGPPSRRGASFGARREAQRQERLGQPWRRLPAGETQTRAPLRCIREVRLGLRRGHRLTRRAHRLNINGASRPRPTPQAHACRPHPSTARQPAAHATRQMRQSMGSGGSRQPSPQAHARPRA